MTSPAAEPPTFGTHGFHTLIDAATAEIAAHRNTAAHALEIGLFPDQIIAFARGSLPTDQKQAVARLLARSDWALGRVTALVKAKRDPDSLGARILSETGSLDPAKWGVRTTSDPDTDLCTLLERV